MLPSNPLGTLEGHSHRVNRLAIHPDGNLIASSSHDETWRLWDIETQKELYMQVSWIFFVQKNIKIQNFLKLFIL